ncbi:hypothetical protein JCM12107_06160 [Corynebacterium simulans]
MCLLLAEASQEWLRGLPWRELSEALLSSIAANLAIGLARMRTELWGSTV